MSVGFDVLVVGAGPGGMAAATVAAEAGARVCLLDDNAAPGGQIWRGLDAAASRSAPHGAEFAVWASRLAASRCQVLHGWQAVDAPSAGALRVERGGEARDVHFENLILATGARERFLPFPGWTLPGVFGAGGLQALVKGGLDARGKRVVLAGSGPLLLAVAANLTAAGARVVTVCEQAPLGRLAAFALTLIPQPGKLAEGAGYRWKTRRTAYRTGTWVARAEGRDRVQAVTLTDGRRQWTEICDWLACGFHLAPNLELPRLLGCRIAGGYVAVVDGLQQSSVAGVACVGELTGIGGLDKALIEGRIAGLAAVGREAEAHKLELQRRRQLSFARKLDQAFALRVELRTLASAETIVCRCEDVSYAALLDCSSARQARLHTRCGMGACQGRVCGAATEFLFGWETGAGRPPIFPAAVSALAAEARVPESTS
jgi:NADPH-dependent 2,4-dienoyl-CoA reductase/sulfur reductase-like enzyme